MDPIYFSTQVELRRWLTRNHDKARELLVEFHKKGSGKPSITWPESVDVALCFGWIDGVRKSLGPESYTIRFTPRRAKSIWSAVNVKRIQDLIALGLVHPAGLKAFQERDPKRAGLYSFEKETVEFDPALEEKFTANEAAWAFFQAQPPWYRRVACHWVMSAKRDETRVRRLETLIADSAEGRRIGAVLSKS